jgi:hypothetical protein
MAAVVLTLARVASERALVAMIKAGIEVMKLQSIDARPSHKVKSCFVATELPSEIKSELPFPRSRDVKTEK